MNNQSFRFRLSDEDRKKLEELAEALDLKPSEVLRQSINRQAGMTKGQAELFKEFVNTSALCKESQRVLKILSKSLRVSIESVIDNIVVDYFSRREAYKTTFGNERAFPEFMSDGDDNLITGDALFHVLAEHHSRELGKIKEWENHLTQKHQKQQDWVTRTVKTLKNGKGIIKRQ